MIMKKKILIVLIAITIIIAGLLVFRLKSTTKEEPQGTQLIPSSFEGPRIPKYIEGGSTIESQIAREGFSFPDSLPVLRAIPAGPFTQEEVMPFAEKLGFASEPIVAEDVSEGTVYIWSNLKDNLVVYSKSRRVEYGLNQTPDNVINKQLSDEALIKISEDFLTKNFLSAAEEISFSFFTFLKSAGLPEGFYQSTKEEASIYQVNFSPVSSEYKILTLEPGSSPIYVWALPDGTISKAIVNKNLNLSVSGEKIPLKNYEEFTASLNKAVLVSLDDGNLLLSTLPKSDVQRIVISEAELVYLMDSSSSESFQPIFLLKGKARVKGYDNEVRGLLYLPAFKTP